MTTEFINKVFDKSGHTRREFADYLHVSPQTVRKWLKGESEINFVNQKAMRIIYRDEIQAIVNGEV